MKLYHGSTVEITEIDFSKSKPNKDFEYMVECMERDLIIMLMEKQGMTMTEAFDTFYNSETHEKLNDARSGLYFQSPGYVYSFQNNEIKYGKFS